MHRPTRPSAGLVIGFLALFAVLGGTATAAKLITSADIRNGTIKTADLSASAKRALKGQRGPAGPQGAPGAAGAAGPQGLQGPAGPSLLSEILEYGGATEVPAGEVFEGSIDCPPGERAVTGGYYVGGSATVYASLATGDRTGWVIAVDNTEGTAPAPAEAYVYCAETGHAVAALRAGPRPELRRLPGSSTRSRGLAVR